MTHSASDELKKELRQELARVTGAITALKKEPRAQELEGGGDNTPLSEDIDAISSAEQEEIRAERLSGLLDRAAALDEALHRVERGTYGICISCGDEIPAERMRAVPEAARCVACQTESERWQPRDDEPLPGEWESVGEMHRERETFDERGFETHPGRIRDA